LALLNQDTQATVVHLDHILKKLIANK